MGIDAKMYVKIPYEINRAYSIQCLNEFCFNDILIELHEIAYGKNYETIAIKMWNSLSEIFNNETV